MEPAGEPEPRPDPPPAPQTLTRQSDYYQQIYYYIHNTLRPYQYEAEVAKLNLMNTPGPHTSNTLSIQLDDIYSPIFYTLRAIVTIAQEPNLQREERDKMNPHDLDDPTHQLHNTQEQHMNITDILRTNRLNNTYLTKDEARGIWRRVLDDVMQVHPTSHCNYNWISYMGDITFLDDFNFTPNQRQGVNVYTTTKAPPPMRPPPPLKAHPTMPQNDNPQTPPPVKNPPVQGPPPPIKAPPPPLNAQAKSPPARFAKPTAPTLPSPEIPYYLYILPQHDHEQTRSVPQPWRTFKLAEAHENAHTCRRDWCKKCEDWPRCAHAHSPDYVPHICGIYRTGRCTRTDCHRGHDWMFPGACWIHTNWNNHLTTTPDGYSTHTTRPPPTTYIHLVRSPEYQLALHVPETAWAAFTVHDLQVLAQRFPNQPPRELQIRYNAPSTYTNLEQWTDELSTKLQQHLNNELGPDLDKCSRRLHYKIITSVTHMIHPDKIDNEMYRRDDHDNPVYTRAQTERVKRVLAPIYHQLINNNPAPA